MTREPFAPGETRAWLEWIARHMQREHQTVFLVENLQPSWLANARQRAACALLDAAALGALTGVIFCIMWWVSALLDPPSQPQRWIPLWLWVGVTAFWAMLVGLVDNARLPWLRTSDQSSKAANVAPRVVRTIVMVLAWVSVWILVRLAFNDSYAAVAGCGRGDLECPESTGNWLDIGHPLFSSAYLALIYGVKIRGDTTVKPIEALGWSWRAALRGLGLGAVAGLVVWIGYAAYWWSEPFAMTVRNILLYPPLGAVGGFVIGGLSVRVVRSKSVPNQGIWLSLRNALLGASIFGPVLALAAWPVLLIAIRPIAGGDIVAEAPVAVVWLGVVAVLVGFAWFGGREVIMHVSLRLVLAATRQTPRDLVRFLDHCVELDFLRRVGGGYVFIHRYLLEYFGSAESVRVERR
jgi:hypothetical protein